jgi:uncharacterized flavoprotein (TIGR03862 family)
VEPRLITTDAAIIGGGPAGLFAAEQLATRGFSVTVFDQMPSVGRKFLLAGRGGLNLTHSEPLQAFAARYGWRHDMLEPMLAAFPPDALREWALSLGEASFVGTSGRVFPAGFKATPLLRAWLARLRGLGVVIETRQRWTGFDAKGRALFTGVGGARTTVESKSTLMAMGGASWPRMGSDGAWVPVVEALRIPVAPLRPANCGLEIAWSPLVIEKAQGKPLKRIAITGAGKTERGEAMITAEGLEGGAVYAILDGVREEIARNGRAILTLDLRADRNLEGLAQDIARQPPSQSTSNRLRKGAKLDPTALMVLNEASRPLPRDAAELAALIKAVPLTTIGVRPLARAISTAGGVLLEVLDGHLMVKEQPGLFFAGEMLDWEAPTGGYLLQGCFSSAMVAAQGMAAFMAGQKEPLTPALSP